MTKPARIVARDAAIWVGIALGALMAVRLAGRLSHVLVLVVIAALVATALAPAVGVLERRLRLARAGAVALIGVGFAALAAGAAMLIVPALIDAAGDLASAAPAYIERLSGSRAFATLDEHAEISARLSTLAEQLPERIGGLEGALGAAQTLVRAVLDFVTVVVLVICLLAYGPRMRAFAIAALAPARRPAAQRLCDELARAVAGSVAGTLSIAALAGGSAYAVLALMGVPHAALLAVLVGVMGLIPLVGATIGAAAAVLAAFSVSVPVGVGAIVWFVAYQQLENHLIQPLVMRRAVSLNPLVMILAVLAGAALAGVVGALLAAPAAAAGQVLCRAWWAARRPPGPAAD